MPSPLDGPADGPIAYGGDFEPSTLLAAYRAGLFPMPLGRGRNFAWWSPDPRGVIPLDGLKVSRSLARSVRRHVVTVDAAFATVLAGCADPRRPGGWINRRIRAAYGRLHELGWCHSVEAWTESGELAGGLYGVAIGGLFAGESMFHRHRDGSKVALVGLVERLRADGAVLLDVQWTTDHLRSLGAVDVPRADYLEALADAVARPPMPTFAGPPDQPPARLPPA
ncbi:MAG: leucyl/phenylalanyl-tRNA--protein transferase [Acidimicrobiales bacterium]|nr:leucyl/phenylalanyl-tRNA--protein transferase [Acidimicrobiales bacterium]